MEDLKDKIESLAENAMKFVDTYYHLSVLNIGEKIVSIFSTAFIWLGVFFAAIFILFFAGMGLSIYLSKVLNSLFWGYFLVAAVYLVLIVILFMLRKKIFLIFFKNIIIKKIYQ